MSFLAVRSVQLSTDTSQAWRSAGVRFTQRGLNATNIYETGRLGYRHLLNLGLSRLQPRAEQVTPCLFWNHGKDIEPLLYPGATRALLDDLMPPRPTTFPADVWIKAPGAQGRGKFRKAIEFPLTLPSEWDWQVHVEGTEYRCVTVGPRIVQDLVREGDNGNRSYRWVAMRDVPRHLKDKIREAARRVPGNNVIAWDAIVTPQGTSYIFEGNTCPGVSKQTVERILNEMHRQAEEGATNAFE